MQIKINFAKTSPYLGWRIASILVIGAMCASIMTACYFMYQNIYRVLDDANTIIVLNATDGAESIDTASFDKAYAVVQAKANLPAVPQTLRNIFEYGPTSTIHVITTPIVTSSISTTTR